MVQLLITLSQISVYVIVVAFFLHLSLFIVLWFWYRRDLRIIASSLDDFTRDLKHRSVLDSTAHLSDQVEAFLADVNEVLGNEGRESDRKALLSRINVLDEKRRYLGSLFFETGYNLSRTMIEAYPLAGILGTILAIGAALQEGGPGGATSVGVIVMRFGEAIWSTFAGLSSAIMLMFLNSLAEPRFLRLAQIRTHVRDVIARAKRELSLRAGNAA